MNIPWKTLAGGISMPELGQGTWRLGGVSERDPGNDDARDVAVALFVHPDKPSGQALRRGGQQGEVHLHFLALLVAEVAHVFDDLQALLLHLFALAVVVAVEGGEGLRQADEADGQGAVL